MIGTLWNQSEKLFCHRYTINDKKASNSAKVAETS